MPSISGMLRGAYAMAGKGLNRASDAAFNSVKAGSGIKGVAQAAGGFAAGVPGAAASRMAGMGTGSMMAWTGAGVGAAYGAMSDDTSVLGGALIGAGLGAGGVGARRGFGYYKRLRGRGVGRGASLAGAGRILGRQFSRTSGLSGVGSAVAGAGKAVYQKARSQASAAGAFIGSIGKKTKPVNPVPSGMKAGTMPSVAERVDAIRRRMMPSIHNPFVRGGIRGPGRQGSIAGEFRRV